jgi:hypothetical protein
MQTRPFFLLLSLSLTGCASQWKIQGGPQECVQMCRSWNMELTGMVGVGNQDATGPGATACVCQVKRAPGAPASAEPGASGTAASSAAVIAAIEEEQQRQREQARAK